MQEEGSDSSSCYLNGQLAKTTRPETDQQKETKRSMEEILPGNNYCSFSALIDKAVTLTPHLILPAVRLAKASLPVGRQATVQKQRLSFFPNPKMGTTSKGICPDKQCSPLSLLDIKRP